MALTAKQEAFAQCIADGMTQADAYRTAYSAANATDKTVWEKAARLMAEGKVRARVDELRQALSERLLWAREDSVKVLAKIAKEDPEAPHSAIVSAVKELNAMHGYNEPTKVDLGLKGVTRVVVEGIDGSAG
jgi:predicted Ser/Thr protein kinase